MAVGSVSAEKLLSKIEKDANGCWNWTDYLTDKGYGRVAINGRPEEAHRASYRTFVGAIPDGAFVCHRCDNRRCVNPSHLFLGTQKDNMQDAARKGRIVQKLNPAAVVEIRRRRAMGHRVEDLAVDFGVSIAAISHAANRKTWQHVA